jgi:hypothetical protein
VCHTRARQGGDKGQHIGGARRLIEWRQQALILAFGLFCRDRLIGAHEQASDA